MNVGPELDLDWVMVADTFEDGADERVERRFDTGDPNLRDVYADTVDNCGWGVSWRVQDQLSLLGG